jgi:hypothetical protein
MPWGWSTALATPQPATSVTLLPRFAGGKLDVDAFGFDGHQDDDAEGFATVKLKGGR